MKVVIILLLFGLLQFQVAKAHRSNQAISSNMNHVSDGQDVFNQNKIEDVSKVKIWPVIENDQVMNREIRSSLNRRKNGKAKDNGRRKNKSNKSKRKKLKRKGTQKRRVGKVRKIKGSQLKRKSTKKKRKNRKARKLNGDKNNSQRKHQPKKARKGIHRIDKRKKTTKKAREVSLNNCTEICKRSSNFHRQIIRLNRRSKIISTRAQKSNGFKLLGKIITSKCQVNSNTSHQNNSLLGCATSITSICIPSEIPNDLTKNGKCLPSIEKFQNDTCGDPNPCNFKLTDWTTFVKTNTGCKPTNLDKTMSLKLKLCSNEGVKPCKLPEADALEYIANCQLPQINAVCSTDSTPIDTATTPLSSTRTSASITPNSSVNISSAAVSITLTSIKSNSSVSISSAADTISSASIKPNSSIAIVTATANTTSESIKPSSSPNISSATIVTTTANTINVMTTPTECSDYNDCKCQLKCEVPPWNTTGPGCEYCNNGICTPGCTKEKDMCPDNYTCNEQHKCEPECACESNSDCSNYNTLCQLHFTSCKYCKNCTCIPGCNTINSQANCPDNYTCNENHECVPNVCLPVSTPDNSTTVNTTTTTLATTTTTIPPTTTPPCNSSNDCGIHPCSCEGQCAEAEQDPCYYCNNGKCHPGCDSNLDCKNGHMCLHHVCIHDIGKVAMESLIMTSINCTGCDATDETGAKIVIKGDPSRYQCIINNLGNASDYITNETKTFSSEQELGPTQNGGCYKGDLDGFKITDFTVTWNGQGAWTPGNFTITYINYPNTRVECKNVDGVTLPNGPIRDATFKCGEPYDIRTLPQ